jgi:hypothetical protein
VMFSSFVALTVNNGRRRRIDRTEGPIARFSACLLLNVCLFVVIIKDRTNLREDMRKRYY